MLSWKGVSISILSLDINKKIYKLDNPKEDIDTIRVEGAMDKILSNNIFISNGVDLVSFDAARVITTVAEEIEF